MCPALRSKRRTQAKRLPHLQTMCVCRDHQFNTQRSIKHLLAGNQFQHRANACLTLQKRILITTSVHRQIIYISFLETHIYNTYKIAMNLANNPSMVMFTGTVIVSYSHEQHLLDFLKMLVFYTPVVNLIINVYQMYRVKTMIQ